MWSGAFSDWIAARMTKQEELFSEIVRRLCAQTGPVASSPIACLEGVVVGALLDAATQAVEAVCSGHACLQPTIDGVELTDDPRSLFAVPSAVPGAVPMMLGSTIDEGDGFDAGGGLSHQSSAQQARGLPLMASIITSNCPPHQPAGRQQARGLPLMASNHLELPPSSPARRPAGACVASDGLSDGLWLHMISLLIRRARGSRSDCLSDGP